MIALQLAVLMMAMAEPQVAKFSSAQLLAAGLNLQREGKAEQALALYAVLDADPSPQVRVEALIRRASILAREGKPRDAAVLMRKVVDLDPQRGEPRIVLARLLEGVGDLDGARRQLRAAQAGPLTPGLSRIAERYANRLRDRAPFGWSVEFSLAPDSNINRATSDDTLKTVIGTFDLDTGARPRSGVGVGARASAFARLSLSESASWLSRLDATHDRYADKDFDRTSWALSTGPDLTLGSARLAIAAGAGQSNFGGRAFQRWAQVSARGFRPLGKRTGLTVSAAGASIDNRLNDLQDGRSLSASIALDRALSPNLGVQAQLSANRFAARDPGYSTRSGEVSVGAWLDIGRFTLTAGISKGRLNSDKRLSLFPAKRTDSSTRFSLGATARSVRFMTFSPFVRLNVERNASSIEIWDYHRRRFEVGLQRAY